MISIRRWVTALLTSLILTSCTVDSRQIDIESIQPGTSADIGTGSLYIPLADVGDNKYPLIVLLHGLSKNNTDFLNSVSFRREAEDRGYMLFAPKSIRYFWLKENNTLDTYHMRMSVNQICREFPVNRKKILLFGWGDGGSFLATNLVQNERNWLGQKLFSAGVMGSTLFTDEFMETGSDTIPRRMRVPLFFFFGELEQKNYEDSIKYLEQRGAEVTKWTHPGAYFLHEAAVEAAFDWFDRL